MNDDDDPMRWMPAIMSAWQRVGADLKNEPLAAFMAGWLEGRREAVSRRVPSIPPVRETPP
jgi:hypothetical protein